MKRKVLSIFLSVALILTFMPSYSFATYTGENVNIEVSSDTSNVQTNSTFTLTVKLKTAIAKLGSFKATMDYDENKVDVVSVTNKLSGGSTEDTEDNNNKYIVFTWDTDGDGVDIDANSNVFTVTFKVKSSSVGENLAPELSIGEGEFADATYDQNDIPFTIEQATVKIPKHSSSTSNYDINLPSGATYDGTAKTATVTAKSDAGAGAVSKVYYNGSETAPADAGTYKVTFDVAEGTNYEAATGLSAGSFTIAKADATITADDTKTLVKGQTLSLGAAIVPNTLALTYKSGDTSKVTVDAQGNIKAVATAASPVNVTVSFAGNNNYNAVSKTVKVTVTEKTIVNVTFASPDAVNYSESQTYSLGSKFTAASTTSTGGTIKYVYDKKEYSDLSDLTASVSDAGTYTVKAVYESDTEYGEKEASFVINKINQAALAVSCNNSVTYGSELTLATTGGSGDGEVTYAIVAGETGSAVIKDGKLIPTKAGTVKVKATKAASTNYNEAVSEVKDITISPKSVTITGVTAENKVYDGTVSATATNGALEGIVKGDTVTIKAGTAEFADKNAGTGKEVTFSGYSLEGTDAANYTLAAQPASVNANITQKEVTITGVTAADKVYDGTVSAIATNGVLEGIVKGDTVTIKAGTAEFADKNAGTNKEVKFSGYSLEGTDAANYTLAAQPASIKANITQKEVSITGVTATTRGYNGSKDVTLTGATLSGVVESDTVSVTGGKGTVKSADAGENKEVTVTGYELTGTDKANYTLAGQPEGIKVTISKIDNVDEKNAKVTAKYGSDVTVDISTLLKPGYKIGTISKADSEIIVSDTLELADGKLTFKLAAGTEDAADATATVTVPVTETTNYNAYNITVAVTATAKTVPVIDAKDYVTTYNGEAVGIEAITKTAKADGKEIAGTWSFDGEYNLTNANTGIPVVIKFTPEGEDAAGYAAATAVIKVTINKAKPTGTPAYTKITEEGKTLKDAGIAKGSITPDGTIAWDRPDDVAVEKNTAYGWTFTPTDANYEVLTGTVTPWAASSSGGGGGGGAIVPPATEDKDVVTDKTSKATTTTVKETKTETVKNEAGQNVSKTTATVSADIAKELVSQAVSNKSETIEITVKSNGGNKADAETSTELAIPKSAVESIVKNTEASLVVKTDSGEVTLDNKALETIAAETDGDTVKIVVGEDVQLSEAQKPAKDAIGDKGKIFDLRAVVGNKYVHDFKGGKAHVAVPVPEKLKGKAIVVIYINDKGLCEILNHTMQTVGADSFIKFATTHFSTFAVVEKADAEKLIAQQTDVNTLIKEVNLKVTTSKTSKKSIKAVVSGDVSKLTDAGYTVKYKFFRSTKKASNYVGKTGIKSAKKYVNTAGKKGAKYYYKVRAYIYDGDKLVGKTALKQCKYGVRTWTKK